jgi:hypothetical protein
MRRAWTVSPWLGSLLAALIGGTAAAPPAGAAALSPILDGIRWGESSDELARHFGRRAKVLSRPIDFGDLYVDVALTDQLLGGFPFVVYFQMSRSTHGLERVMIERQRHGANPKVFRSVVAALSADYGAASASCQWPAMARNGYQASSERLWWAGDRVIRAVFRDTTLEASEGCLHVTARPCGLTGQLFVQITPFEPVVSPCG